MYLHVSENILNYLFKTALKLLSLFRESILKNMFNPLLMDYQAFIFVPYPINAATKSL